MTSNIFTFLSDEAVHKYVPLALTESAFIVPVNEVQLIFTECTWDYSMTYINDFENASQIRFLLPFFSRI